MLKNFQFIQYRSCIEPRAQCVTYTTSDQQLFNLRTILYQTHWRIQYFSDGEGMQQPLSLGQKPNIWQDFCRKLRENERNWTERRAFMPSAPWIRK